MQEDKALAWTLEETADAYALWVELPSPEVRWAFQGHRLVLTCDERTCLFALPVDCDIAHARVDTIPRQARIHLPRLTYQKSA